MNAHTPFDAKQDWTNPYCQNSSNDPMVDALLGNAYHVVRTVYCNLGNLKLIYDFLNQYGMVLGVQSEAELKALTTKAKYARIYGFSRAGDRQVTDYLYVEGDRTGIIPDDPEATGSWITVATTGSYGGGTSSGEGAYIPWVYSNGSATGGETTINVPDGTVGVPFIIINGDMQYVGRGFEFNVDSLSVTLAQPLEEGDEVVFLLTGVPALPDNPNVNDWIQINWLYNNGVAVGGEQVIAIPYTFQSIPAVYKNGLRLYKGLTTESYTADPDNQRILLTEPLASNDRLIVQIGGEAQVLEASDHTLQEVARAANVKDSEVILSTDTTQVLNGKKVIYDVVTQHIYGLPTLPTNVYINTVSNGQLTYSPGDITVDLELAPNSIQNIYDKLDSVDGAGIVNTTKGFTVQELLDVTTVGYYPGMDTISTPLLADKTALAVYKPLTVVDSDNQGAKVISDTSIVGVFPNKNPIKTTGAIQSALRLAGSNITLKQLRGEGVATSSNTATSEFITSRMASLVDGITVRGLIVDDVFVTGFTSGIAISGMEDAIFNNIRGENLKYSPTGLNSAGGYLFVFGGNTSKNITINNVHHKLIPGADRHTLYISAEGTEVGWENVLCENINCDWSANSVTNIGVNNSPFAMSPINVRTGNGLVINNYTVRGYVGSIVSLLNERGPITNVVMNNMVALGCQSFQNGSIMEIGSIVVGNGQYTPRNSNITISNCNTRISRGVDNNGARMPAGSDIGVSGGNVDFLNIIDSQFTTESGPAIKLTGCNDVLIDNINDNMTDVTSSSNSIVLTNCNRVTIGKIRSNRAPTGTKERVYTLSNCSDVTCLFPRRVAIYIKGTTITVNEDRWNILNGVPTVNGNTINVPVLSHLTANAKRTCAVINNTLGNITAVRVGDVDINTLRIGFWDTSTNAISPIGSVDNVIYIDFYC